MFDDELREFFRERARRSRLLYLLTKIELDRGDESAEAREARTLVKRYFRGEIGFEEALKRLRELARDSLRK